jgi:zinc transporter ZupT
MLGYVAIMAIEKVIFGAVDHGHGVDGVDGVDGGDGRSDTHTPKTSPLILLTALSVHSFLETLALGLTSSKKDLSLLTLSIGLHQPAESVAVLVAFVKSGMPVSSIIKYLTLFSMVGPIGVITGTVLHKHTNSLINSLTLSIVAGTFIYVAATEIIPEEFDGVDRYTKFGGMLTGMCAIFGITRYTNMLEGSVGGD